MAKTATAGAPPPSEIRPVTLAEALGERYLSYALSTIMARSLPDVRDGMKPIHRRLLFAMRQLHLDPGAGYKKSARVVGDVMGKFHPHGEGSIYDAMVRLSQDFAARYPLDGGQAGRADAGPRLPDRRRAGREPRGADRGLSHRPRLAAPARPLDGGEAEGRRLAGGGHRDPLPGAEIAADREDRRAAAEQEADAAGRRARR